MPIDKIVQRYLLKDSREQDILEIPEALRLQTISIQSAKDNKFIFYQTINGLKEFVCGKIIRTMKDNEIIGNREVEIEIINILNRAGKIDYRPLALENN